MASGSLQKNCNREGFNNRGGTSDASKVRIGILGNEQNTCGSTDSLIGVGGNQASKCNSNGVAAGNQAGCKADAGQRQTPGFAYIFARRSSP